jgi:hypothetical protein
MGRPLSKSGWVEGVGLVELKLAFSFLEELNCQCIGELKPQNGSANLARSEGLKNKRTNFATSCQFKSQLEATALADNQQIALNLRLKVITHLDVWLVSKA